jgi:hypothetical protein
MKLTQAENSVLLLGAVALATLVLTGRNRPAAFAIEPSAQADDPDYWLTPFYLRSNMPVENRSTAVMPNNAWASWSLGVPQPSSQRGSGYGR